MAQTTIAEGLENCPDCQTRMYAESGEKAGSRGMIWCFLCDECDKKWAIKINIEEM